ncbi:MAG: SpoIIE family protein phosphatase [Bacilli bacterium]|nr:SpoIIE family protein phosphatase [Bacilli bacterium]
MDALNVLRFLGISLIPFAVAVLIHLIFKFTNPLMVRKPEYLVPVKRKFLYKYVKYPLQKFAYIIFTTKKGSYWWRMSVLGVVFAVLSIVGYFFGIEIPVADNLIHIVKNDYFVVGNSTISPVIAGLVFGWPAGVISGVIAFIFRVCMGGWLGWPTSIALLLSGGVTAACSHFIFKDKRPKWYFGILIGIFVETFNIFLIYLFNIKNITEVYTLVSTFDLACIGFAALSVGLTNICISLIEKEHLFIRKKELNNISFHVELALVIACVVGIAVMTTSVRMISSTKSTQDYRKIALETNEDIRVEFDEASKVPADSEDESEPDFGYISDILYSLPERHHVGTGGYVVTVAGKGGNIPVFLKPGEYYPENNIISVRRDSAYTSLENTPFYFQMNGEKGFQYLTDGKYNNGVIYNAILDDEALVPCLMVFNCINFTFGNEVIAQAYIVVIIPYYEIESSSGVVFRISLYTNLMVVIALFTFAEYFVNQKIVKRVEMMDRSLEEIMDGNLDKELHIEGYNEFTNLSNNINLTVGALKNYAQEVELRIDNELKFARDIQTGSVPTAFPFEKAYNIYAKMEPAKEVGGDFYDYFKMNNGRILFLIADVSGKGIPAAMFMMRAKTLIKSLSSTDIPLEDIVNTANKELCAQNEASLFVTAWIGILDPNNGELRYINAGHMNPLLKKKNGKFAEFPNKHNFVLAAMPDYQYKTEIAYLEPGDELVLYTDGVTEAHNSNKELYGVERLINLVNNAQYFNAKQLLDEISDDVVKYADGVEQFDDTTLLIMRYIGNQDIIPETAITLKARPTNAVLAVNFVESVLAKYELPPTFIARVSIVIDELFANIAFYAYPQDYVGEATIQVDFRNEAFYLTLIDSGIPFDPTAPREVDTSSSIEDRKRGGLGIFIVKKTMDEMKYEYKDRHNTLNLVKYLKNIPQQKKEEPKVEETTTEVSAPVNEAPATEEVKITDPAALDAALASLPDDEPAPSKEEPKITDPAALDAALASLPDDEPPAPKADDNKDNSSNS